MRYFFVILFAALSFDGFNHIAKTNALKKKAEEAMETKAYPEAITLYHQLIDSMKVQEDAAILNLSNAYFMTKDTTNAEKYFEMVSVSDQKNIRTVANQQLGVIDVQKQQYDQALQHFKMAMKADPQNESARYNYELVKKIIEQNQKQNQEKPKLPPLTAFAKQLKKQADQLVSRHAYQEAVDLLENGLQKDKSVGHYNDFIHRSRVVAEINKN
ncbi:hypothetical protein [Persicobacter psychrovividus]|uniref:Tetratricopeptide repeat protein n=1 Tax=Persicobacter psychrovividus TaxID=387638 RepID=A0ABM7VCX6_9BACT|nr:hypothetical protein PEPS_08130 [Persicobacter psychrovividus]